MKSWKNFEAAPAAFYSLIHRRMVFWRLVVAALVALEAHAFTTSGVQPLVPWLLAYGALTILLEWLLSPHFSNRSQWILILADTLFLALYTYLRREYELPVINFFVFVMAGNGIILLAALRRSAVLLAWSAFLFLVTYVVLMDFYLWNYLRDLRVVVGGPLIILLTTLAAHTALRAALSAEREAASRIRLGRFLSQEIIRELDRADRADGVFPPTDKEVTILFADIRGFTTLAQSLPPDQTLDLLNRFIDCSTSAVFECGGTVDKYIGDCVMAVFGAPLKKADDAERAVLSALNLLDRVERWNGERQSQALPPLRIGIGLNTSVVLAGTVGSRHRIEYTVIGDGVNVASRVSDLTKKHPHSIILTSTTYQRLPDSLRQRCQNLGTETLRGRTGEIQLFGLDP